MHINLFTTFYVDKNESRNIELESCIVKNLQSGFDKIVFLVENEKEFNELDEYLTCKCFKENTTNIEIVNVYKRPSFNDFLKEMDLPENAEEINIIANSETCKS